jgi:UDP-N-acetylmuramoylalanine--D-glutamate ligase
MKRQHNGKKLIVGMGQTGLSCAHFCRLQGWEFDACDSRAQPPGLNQWQAFKGAELFCGDWQHLSMSAYETLIVSPGVALSEPAIAAACAAGVEVVGDVQLFVDAIDKPFICITGSNGKSTVTTLVAGILQALGKSALAIGNIGVPVLDVLTQSLHADIYVLELSSFQLETCQRLPSQAATLLNLTADHMDRYASMKEYWHAKQRIFNAAKTAVVNLDDDYSRPRQAVSERTFSLQQPADVCLIKEAGRDWIQLQQKPWLAVDELRINGDHNVANVLAALALVDAAGFGADLDCTAVRQYVREFCGLPHRCQTVAVKHGVRFINDSKGTNVGSTLAAIDGLRLRNSGRLFWLAGGVAKGQDFSPLAQICQQRVMRALLFGQDAKQIALQLDEACDAQIFTSMTQALEALAPELQGDDVVLLSPACASFDQFKNFEQRGDAFIQAVEQLEVSR